MSTSLVPPVDTAVIRAQIEAADGVARLRALLEPTADVGPEISGAVVEEAAKFSEAWLSPFLSRSDVAGCRIEDGRVKTSPGHPEAWAAYLESGWLGIDQPAEYGGQELPQVLLAACQEIFDRGSVAFGMLPTAQRGAARLLAAHADEATRAEWLPRLVSGEWGATICISEPDAGSDVGRIRTLATPGEDGDWRITGEKIWISYGDHDLASRIGHCLLARTPDAPPGGAGLSLFLAPDTLDGTGERNGIVVRRLEEKLGLHGSPTCAMGFENARARLIGTQGRGLAQLFTMIATMRLMVSVQGLSVAGAAADVALAYAEDRRQGGSPAEPALPIARHADVQRMLMAMASRAEVLRGLIYSAAVHADLGTLETDPEARARSQALTAWLLPIAKTFAGESAFDNANEAIQVLGGAGYVRDWPVEQLLRDCRVFTIFEGTSGIQALDLVHRRLRRDEGKGLNAFLALARRDLDRLGAGVPGADALARTLDLLEAAAALMATANTDSAAYPFLRLAAYAAMGWSALRLAAVPGTDPAGRRLAAAGRHWLADLEPKAVLEDAQIRLGDTRLELFEALRRPA